mmetsp:Transcript_36937/g.96659  ORF Transcript_36937/g.96659 Transcript_36937/m.96659 type:complete len:263 (+) Transcript_36937:1-789(+)
MMMMMMMIVAALEAAVALGEKTRGLAPWGVPSEKIAVAMAPRAPDRDPGGHRGVSLQIPQYTTTAGGASGGRRPRPVLSLCCSPMASRSRAAKSVMARPCPSAPAAKPNRAAASRSTSSASSRSRISLRSRTVRQCLLRRSNRSNKASPRPSVHQGCFGPSAAAKKVEYDRGSARAESSAWRMTGLFGSTPASTSACSRASGSTWPAPLWSRRRKRSRQSCTSASGSLRATPFQSAWDNRGIFRPTKSTVRRRASLACGRAV